MVRPLVEQDTKTLQRLLPEIPSWVKNPDYDRVCFTSVFSSQSCTVVAKVQCAALVTSF